MADFIKLTEDYAYDDYRISSIEQTTIDASEAHWIVSNWGDDVNRYPVLIDNSDAVTLVGGTITGEVPLDLERKDIYVNSAAIFLRDTDDSLIQNWTIKGGAWDGIRIRGSDNFTIDQVWMDEVRDDAIENDSGISGTISNSLFDNVFVGLSTADANTSNMSSNVVTIDNVLMRMKNFLHDGKMTHQSPFKVTSDSPSMEIRNSIIAIENVDHIGQGRLETAWEKTIDASGNYFLNLSDEPLPKDYPMPPEGFTVLQGEEARTFWEAARADWIAEFDGDAPTDDSSDATPPDTSEPDPDPETDDGTDADSGAPTSPDQFEAHYNVGKDAVIAEDGTVFESAAGIMSGDYTFRDKDLSISGTESDELYDSYAFGDTFRFAVDVQKEAVYRVELHLAETWNGAVGERIFDVALEGKVPSAFDDIDIVGLSGGKNAATTISAEVEVTDGVLDIDVETLVDNGLINGISVYETGPL